MRAKTTPRTTWFLVALCCALLAAVPLVLAQSNGGYHLSWWTVDGGGGTLEGAGAYTLAGTIGQLDADVLAGGGYALAGGFWAAAGSAPPDRFIYLPLVARGQP